MAIKVGVNGCGTIGKRVADAVMLQDDMELLGIAGRSYNYRVQELADQKIPIYEQLEGELSKNGISVKGSLDDLLGKIDVIVDTAPGKLGAENKTLYEKIGVKAIFQGGEKAGVADVSFCAQCNYDKAVGKKYIRVVSCNTTGLSRTLGAVDKAFGVQKARATMIRRAADPMDSKKGPINAIVPVLKLPSHHGPDVQTVLPNIDIVTTAVAVPTTIMHLHIVNAKLKKTPEKSQVVSLFENTTRVRLVSGEKGITSTAQIMELARDMGRKRGDMQEICVWEESIGFDKDELYYIQAIHQESDVVPENIDAIRAATGYKDGEASIKKTNKAMGLK